ncbi:MAG: GNAT family N-acetyltransferase [Hyphomicrobiales bacterium]|nr:GNAT family N-acetyltransferase [Hyphomicrobiales bacterium]
MSLAGTLETVAQHVKTMPFRRTEIHASMESCAAAWSRLEACAPVSWYQTRHWATAWCDSLNASGTAALRVIVAYDEDDQPCLLLPLVMVRQGLLQQARFIGARDSNFNLPLFRSQDRWDKASVQRLLRQAAHQMQPRPDSFVLLNQPGTWDGATNPLTLPATQPSPSFGHRGALQPQGEALLEKLLSKDHRKKLARKFRRLQEMGPAQCGFAETPQAIEAAIMAFCEQKSARLRDMGVTNLACDARTLDFMRRLSHPAAHDEPARMRWATLQVGERIVATYGGGIHRGQFNAMVNSICLDPEIARSSPGECLLNWLVARCCEEGLTSFDLGIGEGGYKKLYCPEDEPLFDAILPISATGFVAAHVQRAALRMKRAIKQNDVLWAGAQRVRRRLLSREPALPRQ